MGCSQMLKYHQITREKLDKFGISPDIKTNKKSTRESFIFRDYILILPSSGFLMIWETFVILTLMYIGTLGIYVQTFMDENAESWQNTSN